MNSTVNVQAKRQLAKLLAMEDITVVHAGTRTATFDPKRRILTLPIWKEMSGDLYDLFVLHEVGHALFTPEGSKPLIDACNAIDPLHPKAAKGFINVLEDARIERLIKNLYPGSRANFVRGYKELIARNFFRTRGRDLSKMGIIDRLNIHFKAGSDFNIPFNDVEMEFIKRIEAALTFQDVIDIGKDLYKYAKLERAEKKRLEQEQEDENEEGNEKQFSRRSRSEESDEDNEDLDPDADDSEDLPEDEPESDLETDDDDSDEEGEKDGSKEGKESDRKSNRSSDDEGDEEGSDEDPEGKGEEGKPDKDDEEESEDTSPVESETDNAWNETQDDLRDKEAKPFLYLGIPEPKLDKIIVGYKEVHRQIRDFYVGFDVRNQTTLVPQHVAEFDKFKHENKPVVDWLVKEFEMHKAADQYARASVAKTGVLDLTRLHEYKYSDDIMKRNTIIPGGKNHASLIFLDWSGSMRKHILGSVHQMINLAMFQRKVNNPFRVFTFGALKPGTSGTNAYNRSGKANNEAFVHKEEDFAFFDTFILREILSSNMSQREFNEACVNLLLLASGASGSEWQYSASGQHFVQLPITDQLGATPLNEAVIAAIPLVKQMYKGGAQFVNVSFITDGEATTQGYYTKNAFGDCESINVISKRVVIRDSVTRNDYSYVGDSTMITDIFLKILKDRTGATTVGFFISGDDDETEKAFKLFMRPPGGLTNEKLEEYKKLLEKNFFVVSETTGYSEFYILPSGKKLKIHQTGSPLAGQLTNAQLVTAMTEHGIMQRKQRVVLSRYIKLIS